MRENTRTKTKLRYLARALGVMSMDSEELRKFNKRGAMKLKVIGYSFVVFIPIVCVVVFFLKGMEKDITEPLVSAINSSDANATLCSRIELDIQELKIAFDGLHTLKAKGSHPIERVVIRVENIKRIVGRDSRRKDVVWVMPEEDSDELNLLVGGYIRSSYLSDRINECAN